MSAGALGGIPSQAFACADDRLVFIVATTNPQFGRACDAFGRPELVEDPRFTSIAARIEHRLELLEILEGIFREQPRAYWLAPSCRPRRARRPRQRHPRSAGR